MVNYCRNFLLRDGTVVISVILSKLLSSSVPPSSIPTSCSNLEVTQFTIYVTILFYSFLKINLPSPRLLKHMPHSKILINIY